MSDRRYTKKNIIVWSIISVLLIAIIYILWQEFAPVKVLPYYDYSKCSHDNSYQEPVLQDGKYYLDGDTTKCYFEIEDNCIRLIGTDEQLQQLVEKTMSSLFPTNVERLRDEWTETQKYYVYTMHPYGDIVVVAWDGVNFDENGKIAGGAGVILNDTTLSGYACGDFTLV